jgi:hypothetical protein
MNWDVARSTPRSRFERRLFSSARTVVLAASMLALAATACSVASEGGGGPRLRFSSRDVYTFDSLAKMVATSDLVIVGTVKAVEEGRTVGPPAEAVKYVDAELRVEEVLKGSPGGNAVTVETLELDDGGGLPWRSRGQRVLLFLSLTRDAGGAGRYHPTNGQSLYTLEGEDIRTTRNDPLPIRVAARSLSQMRADVEEANRQIARGEVSPEPRRGPSPSADDASGPPGRSPKEG